MKVPSISFFFFRKKKTTEKNRLEYSRINTNDMSVYYLKGREVGTQIKNPPMISDVPEFEPDQLQKQTPHVLDPTIRFDEGPHLYFCQFESDGPFESDNILSTSGFVHQFFPHFDADHVISKMRKGRNFSTGKYAHLTDEEIKQQWRENADRASARGTQLHFLLECHQNGYALEQSKYSNIPEVQTYLKWKREFFDSRGLIPFRTEMRMRTGADLRLTGTADLLAVASDHKPPAETDGVLTLHMIDWKFSRAIKYANRFESGHGPCQGMDNCNYTHYLLQQNTYKWMMETYFGSWVYNGQTYDKVHIASMHLAVFHANHPQGMLYLKLEECTSCILEMVERRRRDVAATSRKRKRLSTTI
jgi:hypothetical protein